jgi:hypothetical protein
MSQENLEIIRAAIDARACKHVNRSTQRVLPSLPVHVALGLGMGVRILPLRPTLERSLRELDPRAVQRGRCPPGVTAEKASVRRAV